MQLASWAKKIVVFTFMGAYLGSSLFLALVPQGVEAATDATATVPTCKNSKMAAILRLWQQMVIQIIWVRALGL